MKTGNLMKSLCSQPHAALAACVLTVAAVAGPAVAVYGDDIILGETVSVEGSTLATWARVNGGGKVIWVGLTIPLSLVENMPPRGTGPAGAVAVLNFPPIVQATTYFDHVQVHSQLTGHGGGGADPNRYMTPHFDLHFFGIPVADAWQIPGGPFFAEVPAERLPAGYLQPEYFSIPQMGRHALTAEEFAATDHWLLTMITGFLPDASYMHIIEPMITQGFLLGRQNFSMPVPRPAVLGRTTSYPTECEAYFDKNTDAYHIVFKGFELIE